VQSTEWFIIHDVYVHDNYLSQALFIAMVSALLCITDNMLHSKYSCPPKNISHFKK